MRMIYIDTERLKKKYDLANLWWQMSEEEHIHYYKRDSLETRALLANAGGQLNDDQYQRVKEMLTSSDWSNLDMAKEILDAMNSEGFGKEEYELNA